MITTIEKYTNEFIETLENSFLKRKGCPVNHITSVDMGEYKYIGDGASRIVFKRDNYVFKVAYVYSGIVQNETEAKSYNGDKNVAAIYGSHKLSCFNNFINVQEYAEVIEEFFARKVIELAGGDTDELLYSETIESIQKLMDIAPDNESGRVWIKILNKIGNTLETKVSLNVDKECNVKDLFSNQSWEGLTTSFLEHSIEEKYELGCQNVGVRVDENGNFLNLAIIDSGFGEEVELLMEGEYIDYELEIDIDGQLNSQPF